MWPHLFNVDEEEKKKRDKEGWVASRLEHLQDATISTNSNNYIYVNTLNYASFMLNPQEMPGKFCSKLNL